MKRRDFILSTLSASALSACQVETSNSQTAVAQMNNAPALNIPAKVTIATSGAGINLTGDWHGNRAGRYPGNLNSELATTLSDGFKHLTFITSCDDFFDFNCSSVESCVNYQAIRRRIAPMLQQIRSYSQQYPDRVFIISLKGYEQVGGWNAPGIKQSYFSRALEQNELLQSGFIDAWKYIAEMAKDIPSDTLLFCLQNEPEWHNYGANITVGRDKWASLATDATDAIRLVTADRIILIEAVHKGTWYRRDHTPSRLVRKIERSGIIYGFHYYGPDPESWTHQIDMGGLPYTQQMRRNVISDIRTLIRWKRSERVPVMITEMGAWGPYFESGQLVSGATAEDRAQWTRDIVSLTFPEGIGITWWGLNEYNTPYKRITYDGPKIQPRLVRDELLWNALELR